MVTGSLTVDGSNGIPVAHEKGSENDGALVVDILSVCDSTAPEVLFNSICDEESNNTVHKRIVFEEIHARQRGEIVSVKQCFVSLINGDNKGRHMTCRTVCRPPLP